MKHSLLSSSVFRMLKGTRTSVEETMENPFASALARTPWSFRRRRRRFHRVVLEAGRDLRCCVTALSFSLDAFHSHSASSTPPQSPTRTLNRRCRASSIRLFPPRPPLRTSPLTRAIRSTVAPQNSSTRTTREHRRSPVHPDHRPFTCTDVSFILTPQTLCRIRRSFLDFEEHIQASPSICRWSRMSCSPFPTPQQPCPTAH